MVNVTSSADYVYAGALCAINGGELYNCHVDGGTMTVTSKHTTGNYANNTSYVAVGSLVRRNVDGSFEHCSSSAALEDCNSEHVEAKGSSDRNTMVGGLVGDNAEDGVIVSSRFDGTMKVEVSANKSDR